MHVSGMLTFPHLHAHPLTSKFGTTLTIMQLVNRGTPEALKRLENKFEGYCQGSPQATKLKAARLNYV